MADFDIVSLKEWWKGVASDEADESPKILPVVDIRESQESRRLSQDGDVTVVHLPFATLQSGERSCELPPRHIPFALLLKEEDLESARTFFGATTSRATQQSRKPWQVQQVLLATEDLWNDASELGILQARTVSPTEFQPLPRLWQPDPMVQNVLWPLLRDRLESVPSSSRQEQVWDLGSGAGRDVCFLAEQTKALSVSSSIQFVGIDHHKASEKRCLPFWKNRHVDDRTQARNVDLSKVSRVQQEMESCHVVCLYAVRFWNATLVNWIAKDAPLEQGTLFAMSHFCKPYPGAPWDFEHPKERSVLDRHELRVIFEESRQWEVLHDELAPDGDHGRTLIQFVAKRLSTTDR